MNAYVDFGYGELNKEITQDGELLATLGFTWEQLADDHNIAPGRVFKAAKQADDPAYKSPHSGESFGCVLNVACVLVKHNWKTVADIPTDHPLRDRVVEY